MLFIKYTDLSDVDLDLLECLKKEIRDERKKQKYAAMVKSNYDSIISFRCVKPDDDMYIRVKDINDITELKRIIDSLKKKSLYEKLSEETYTVLHDFLTNYFEGLLNKDITGDLKVKDRIDLLSQNFGGYYSLAIEFISKLNSNYFKYGFDNDGDSYGDAQGFIDMLLNRLNKAEELALSYYIDINKNRGV